MASGIASFYSFADIVGMASAKLRDYGMAEFPPGFMDALAGEANREFARTTEVVRKTELSPLLLGQAYYTPPEDCLKIEKVSVKYSGDTGFRNIDWSEEERFLNGVTSAQTGRPYLWYLKRDTSQYGLYPVSSMGGIDARTTSAGNTTTVNYSAITATNVHQNQTIRIMDGVCMGEESVVTSNTTGGFTCSPAFSATIASGVRFQVYPDTLSLSYVGAGNEFFVKPFDATVESLADGGYADPLPGRFSLSTLPIRPRNFWVGCQVRFNDGGNAGFKARVTASRCKAATAGKTEFTVSPEFPVAPADGNSLEVCDVPNIPDAYHHALVHYIMAACLTRFKPGLSDILMRQFDRQMQRCLETSDPRHVDIYTQVKRWPYPTRRRSW